MFAKSKSVIGMIHVGALPGTPRHGESLAAITDRAVEEAGVFVKHGLDGIILENMHDVPYLCGQVGPEIVAAMTAVGLAVREKILASASSHRPAIAARSATKDSGTRTSIPLGVQILAAANRAALAVAHVIGADFVRVENFTYAHIADEGLMPTAEAGPLLRYRRQIGAQRVKVVADVKKKHSSHAITSDVSLAEAARTTEFCGADGVVVTGVATGEPTRPEDAATVRESVSVPVWIGSGLTPENLPALWPHADVFVVGSYLKVDGLWSNALDAERVERFLEAARRLRAS
ncbi:MAG: BtpA family membrane complex biogenesis protein [Planctomycetes bacterium]|nr:BtpA family membrane complex biogenesis protein [Planctomycetota bacterium]